MSRTVKPIKKNSLFYSESDYDLESQIFSDYIEQDVNQYITLYMVDRTKTNVDEIYGEVSKDDIIYKEPVELCVLYKIDEPVNKTYDKTQNLARYSLVGNLTITVMIKTLQEQNVDITYGDYIGVRLADDHVEYFCVTDDGKMNFDNKHTLYGYKQLARTVQAVPVDKNEFNGN
jgi:hypothetical protein